MEQGAEERAAATGGDMPPSAARPFVTIAMPVLNEERYVANAILSVLPKTGTVDFEFLVLDGGSTDRTVEIVRQLARSIPQLKLVHNEKRTQSAAMNLAARLADPRATTLVRADCHALYPDGFVAICLATLAQTTASSVVVTMRTTGSRCFQRGVAAAQNSLLGNGGSAHRRDSLSGFVPHGHHAAMDRGLFERIGGYDEALATNEDFDLDVRLAQAGGRIWLEASIPVTYFPRESPGALWRQYFRYGQGRALTFLRHRYRLAVRQMAPVAILIAILASLLLALVVDARFAALCAGYAALCLSWGTVKAITARDRCLLSMGIAAMIMHLAWGAGFLRGLAAKRPGAPESGAGALAITAGK